MKSKVTTWNSTNSTRTVAWIATKGATYKDLVEDVNEALRKAGGWTTAEPTRSATSIALDGIVGEIRDGF